MNEQGERIARVETTVEHVADAIERLDVKFDTVIKSLADDKEKQKAELASMKSRVDDMEIQVKGAKWLAGIVVAILSFLGVKVGDITLGGK